MYQIFDIPPPSPAASGAAVSGELTLADVIRLIEADADLPLARKRNWLSSLRRIAAGIGRPPESIPARLTSLRHPMRRLNAARMGIEPKSLSNHKANVRAAVLHVLKVTDAPRRGVPFSPDWAALMAALVETKAYRLLSGLARYCSSRDILPETVSEAVVTDYFAHRQVTSFLETGPGRVRELMRAWNRCVEAVPGWPAHRLVPPALTPVWPGPAWEAFPAGLRADIEAHLRRLAAPHRSANGRRRRPCKASTIATRRRELMAFARKAVAAGVPMESLVSLEQLLAPEVVLRTFERFLEEGGDRPKVFVIDLGWKLHALAREIGAPENTESQLDDIRVRLEEDRPPAMTDKNLGVVRAVLASDIWSRVAALPELLLREAGALLNRSPRKAAAIAALAAQVLILSRAPVRVGNLLAIRLGVNLIRPGGEEEPFHLTFPNYDVKNRVDLEFPLSPRSSALIQRYIDLFRPHMENSRGTDWLFPGESGSRSPAHASTAIAARVEREVGLRVTAHQFRHAAAATILKQRPGDYEFVRRILGHRNVQTTMKFYTGLEAFRAGEHFGRLVEERIQHRQVQRAIGRGRKGDER
jgi:integrase